MGCRYKVRKGSRIQMTPVMGVVSEQRGPVARTPQFRGWPLFGEYLMAFEITDLQEVVLTVAFTDRKGNPARVDGVPEWLVDNPNVLALTPSADGQSCLVAAVGPLGSATVSMKADADLGAGVTPLAGTFDVSVTAGAATEVTITAGTPVELP